MAVPWCIQHTQHIIYYDGTFFPQSFILLQVKPADFSRLRFFPLFFSEQRRPVRLSTGLLSQK
jgi:hypothetical protein